MLYIYSLVYTLHLVVLVSADSNIEKLRTSSSEEEDEYYDAEGIITM